MPQEMKRRMKAEISVITTEGKTIVFDSEVSSSNTVRLAFAEVPINEIGKWVPAILLGARLRSVKVIGE